MTHGPQSPAIRLLLIEDDVRDAGLVCHTLRQEPAGAFVVDHVTRMPEALAHLAAGSVDVVLLGIGVPHEHGLASLRRVRAAAPESALVVLVSPSQEELAAQAMHAGAQDYLVRGQIEHRTLSHALLSIIGRHRLEQEVAQLRKRPLELRDDFLSRVSHQLRLPLASIDSLAAILGETANSLNAEQEEYLKIILDNTVELQKMIEDLLEITQLQAGKLSMHARPFWLDEVVNRALSASAAQAGEKEISLASRYDAHLPQAFADGRLVLRVLQILLENALKFTPARGAICVEAARYRKNSGFLLVEVCDTGCGLDPEAATRIFEHLYQVTDPFIHPDARARRGLGVGLHIGRELVTLMGGEIWVRSQPQKGSRFCFTLPAFQYVVSPGIA